MSAGWEQVGPDRTAYQGFVRIIHRTLRLPDGRHATWDMLDAPATATVLPPSRPTSGWTSWGCCRGVA